MALYKKDEEQYKEIFRAFHKLVQVHDVGTRTEYKRVLEELKTLLQSNKTDSKK